MDSTSKKPRNILVCTDFSKNADYALLRAMSLAKTTGANLTLIHVVQKKALDNFLDSSLKSLLPKELWLSTEEHRELIINEKIQSLTNSKININCIIIRKGNPAVKILQYARKNKTDLLIIGAHGKYSFRDSFVGTTAEQIVEKSQCPVLMVKNSVRNGYKKILIATDFSKTSKLALNYTLKMFPNNNNRLLHVGDYEYENLLKESALTISKNKLAKVKKALQFFLENKMKDFVKGYGKKITKKHCEIILGYPGPIILREADRLKSDLIVMGTQGHGRHHYLFVGSVANWVYSESDIDVLLVPPKHKKR